MGENSNIQWTHHTFNPWIGCTKVSPACDHCYAEKGSARLGAQHKLKLWGGDRYFTSESYWKQPLAWNRRAEKAGERHRVFCASFADVFEDRKDLVEPRARLFDIVARTQSLDWLLLTKRPENIARMVPWGQRGTHLADPGCWQNVWLGTTVEDQAHLDKRAPELLSVPARVRFLSYEPGLAGINLAPWIANRTKLHWVIVGGESGPKARPFLTDWALDVQRLCKKWNVRFFMKQLGARPMHYDVISNTLLEIDDLKDSHGGDWDEWPRFLSGLKVREFPS